MTALNTNNTTATMTASAFDSIYDGSYRHTYCGDEYIRHEVTVFNHINFKGEKLETVYQNAISNYGDDYNAPACELETSYYGGTDEALFNIAMRDEGEIANMSDERAVEIGESIGLDISNANEMRELKALLTANEINANAYYDEKYGDDFKGNIVNDMSSWGDEDDLEN